MKRTYSSFELDPQGVFLGSPASEHKHKQSKPNSPTTHEERKICCSNSPKNPVSKPKKDDRMRIYSSFPNPSNYTELEELLHVPKTPPKSWSSSQSDGLPRTETDYSAALERNETMLDIGEGTGSQNDGDYPKLEHYLTQAVLEGYAEVKIFDELYTKDELKKADENCAKLIKEKHISSVKSLKPGNFALTFQARWRGQDVVLKVSKEKAGRNELEEIRLLNNISSHPNVLSILAICTDFHCDYFEKSVLAIVTPFQKGGDLQTFLKTQKRRLRPKQLQNLALGMSRGLSRLHKDHIVHRDVCTRNFLLSEYGRVLICDFGLSRSIEPSDPSVKRSLEDQNYYKAEEGSQIAWRWCPPEMLCTRKSDRKSDIWMLGVALWELATQAETPFASLSSSHELYAALLFQQVKLQVPRECPQVIRKLVNECCNVKVGDRPDVDYVVHVLEGE